MMVSVADLVVEDTSLERFTSESIFDNASLASLFSLSLLD